MNLHLFFKFINRFHNKELKINKMQKIKKYFIKYFVCYKILLKLSFTELIECQKMSENVFKNLELV
jgi:hypothetical protein